MCERRNRPIISRRDVNEQALIKTGLETSLSLSKMTAIPIYSSSNRGFDPCTAWCPPLHLTTHSSTTSRGELLVDVLQYNETIATISLKSNGRSGLGRFGYIEMQYDKNVHMMPDTGYSALSVSPPRLSTPYLSSVKCIGNIVGFEYVWMGCDMLTYDIDTHQQRSFG